MKQLSDYIASIPDFPEPGVTFRDITPLLQDAAGLCAAIDRILAQLNDIEFDLIAGPESRGFIFGVPVAYAAKKGFIPIRKAGKLPRETLSMEYELEYGTAVIEMHKDAIRPGQKVVIVDDLIATGGTTKAMIDLIEQAGGEVVRLCFFIELEGLHGRDELKGYDVRSILQY